MSTTPDPPRPIPNFWTSYVSKISLYTVLMWMLMTCLTLVGKSIFRQVAGIESHSSTWLEGFWSTAVGIGTNLLGALLAIVTVEFVKQRRRVKFWQGVDPQGMAKE